MTEPDDYDAKIEADGFVPATRDALVQVMANKASIEQMRTEIGNLRSDMDKVLAALGKRLDKLEKPIK